MARSVRLRPWQHAALARFLAAETVDFLAVATPGAGKTTFALTALRLALAEKARRVIVVTPPAHPKTHGAHAAAGPDLHLAPARARPHGTLSARRHRLL